MAVFHAAVKCQLALNTHEEETEVVAYVNILWCT